MKGLWIGCALSLGMAVMASPLSLPEHVARVRCQENVQVMRSTIQLSDLLPKDAPPALQTYASAISLGRAPEPGSLRVLQGAQLAEKLSGEPEVLRRISFPSQITVKRIGWPFSADSLHAVVADFLRAWGWKHPDLSEGLEFAVDLASAQEHPHFKVTGADWDSSRRNLQIRMRCVRRDDCATFLVRLHVPQDVAGQLKSKTNSSSGFRSSTGSAVAAAGPAARPAKEELLANAGDKAMLVIEGSGLRISLPVICLQPGALQEEIRVRSLGNQRIFRAQVTGKDELRAVF